MWNLSRGGQCTSACRHSRIAGHQRTASAAKTSGIWSFTEGIKINGEKLWRKSSKEASPCWLGAFCATHRPWGKLSTGASLWCQDGSGWPCWATRPSGEIQSQQPRRVVLEMVFNTTWQESCPVLLKLPQHSSSWSALPLLPLSLAPAPGVSPA